jgi:hypothetical protein
MSARASAVFPVRFALKSGADAMRHTVTSPLIQPWARM